MIKSRPYLNPVSGSALAQVDRIGPRDHFVQFYKDDQTLVDCVARFFAVGFAQGNVAVMIATKEHRDAIEARLGDLGLDVERLRANGDYAGFDAAEMLSHLIIDGSPDRHRFQALLGTWMDVAVRSGTGVRAFGEMVALLQEEGNTQAALELEQLWNELGQVREFALFCGYRSEQFAGGSRCQALSDVCQAHSKVIGS
jgi:hypothetical protein